MRTDGDGVATYKTSAADSVSVSIESADALAQVIKPIWSESRQAERKDWVQQDDTTTTVSLFGGNIVKAIADDATVDSSQPKETLEPFPGVDTTLDKPVMLSVQPLVIMVRMLGELFDTDKCFLLPKALDHVQQLVKLHKEYAVTDLLIVGHTDTSGKDDYNLDLSLERAHAMSAYLLNDADAWLKWYDSSKKESKRWGTTEDTYMIETLIEGASDDSSVLGYQHWHNTGAPRLSGYEALDEDGKIGPLTRKQLIFDYMHREDTTVPAGTPIQVHGCGEFFPLDANGEQLEANAADGQHEQEDRRVEVCLFPKELGVLPPVPGEKAAKGELEYAEWRYRSVEITLQGDSDYLHIEWDDMYGRDLPTDLALELSSGGAVIGSVRWSAAPIRDGQREFVFAPVTAIQKTTLAAVNGDERTVLWEEQSIGASNSAITWKFTLNDLFPKTQPSDDPVDGTELANDWHRYDDTEILA